MDQGAAVGGGQHHHDHQQYQKNQHGRAMLTAAVRNNGRAGFHGVGWAAASKVNSKGSRVSLRRGVSASSHRQAATGPRVSITISEALTLASSNSENCAGAIWRRISPP